MAGSKKILIVEDEASMRDVLIDLFKEEAFTVLSAENGKDGLDQAMKEHPDVILLDLLMPEMGGMEVMENIRQDAKWGKHVPIVLLTNLSSADEQRLQQVVKYEPSYYLIKSDTSLQEVLDKVKSVIKS